jgi:LacI family transcriptional regulator
VTKTPTVYDVAERAGVSIATVSFAFRRPERVKESTRESVFAAARELGYVPNASARGLAQRRTGALGLYSYDYLLAESPVEATPRDFPLYVDEVQRGMQLECWRRGLALMTGGGPASEKVVTDIAGRVDGLAVFPQTVPLEDLQHIARRIPVVEVSEPVLDDGLSHVTVDNADGVRRMTTHLVEQHGRRRPVFVGQVASHDVAVRFTGFTAAVKAAGLAVPRAALSLGGDAEAEATGIVAGFDELPDAVVCATDQQALAMIDALQAAGHRVPEDVAVTGFDGILAGLLSRPTLTTVRQPMGEMGRAVVEILLERIAEPSAPPVNRQLPVEVVLRESCGCA